MDNKRRPPNPQFLTSRDGSFFYRFRLLGLAASLAVAFMLSCSTYPTDPGGRDLYELESVWQYLKTYSFWQDKVPAGAFEYGSPREMMKSVYDTLKGSYYTKYYNDPGHSSSGLLEKSADADTVATVGWDSVTASIAYLRISEFSIDDSSTYFQFLNILPYLRKFSTIIIDLIDNGGGGIATTDAIINSILPVATPYILETYRRYGQSTHSAVTIPWDTIKTQNGQDPALKNKRYAVLMNGGSASASEILVAALKDGLAHASSGDTVVLIGDTTYGKGIGQMHIYRTSWNRPDLLITFMRMKGISGRTGDYQRKGIAPDVFVADDPTHLAHLTEAVKILEPTARLNKRTLLQKQLRPSGGLPPEAYLVATPENVPK